MKTIGLTGGICSGKTTLADWLTDKGLAVVDTDRIAHDLYAEEEPKKEILEIFGTVNRKEVRVEAFAHPEKRKKLETILHPRIGKILDTQLREFKKAGVSHVFVLVPLLFEVGWENRFDEIWTLSTPPEAQLDRLEKRGIEKELAKKILQSQFANEDREEKADLVLFNDQTKESLFDQAQKAIESLSPNSF